MINLCEKNIIIMMAINILQLANELICMRKLFITHLFLSKIYVITRQIIKSYQYDKTWNYLRWTVTSLPLYSFVLALLFNIAFGVVASINTSLTTCSVNVWKFLDIFESVSFESIRNNSHWFVTVLDWYWDCFSFASALFKNRKTAGER